MRSRSSDNGHVRTRSVRDGEAAYRHLLCNSLDYKHCRLDTHSNLCQSQSNKCSWSAASGNTESVGGIDIILNSYSRVILVNMLINEKNNTWFILLVSEW